MLRIIAASLGAILALTAGFQLASPLGWYDALPGVIATGPFNAHFVRDIGAAFLVAAAGMLAFAWRPLEARPALLCATGFLVLHAAVHVFDAVCGSSPLEDARRDVGVHVMALIALGLAIASGPVARLRPAA